jgi:hypothetical protein
MFGLMFSYGLYSGSSKKFVVDMFSLQTLVQIRHRAGSNSRYVMSATCMRYNFPVETERIEWMATKEIDMVKCLLDS